MVTRGGGGGGFKGWFGAMHGEYVEGWRRRPEEVLAFCRAGWLSAWRGGV